MDADKFIEQNQPLSKVRSKLSKYRSEILNMKKLGYSHEQIRVFLKGNEITVRVQSISKYFIAHSKNNSDLTIESTQNPTPYPKPETPNPKVIDSVKPLTPPNVSRKVNSPEELRKLMSAPVDIKAILKAAKDIDDAEKAAKLGKL